MKNVKFENEVSNNGRNEYTTKVGATQQIENSIATEKKESFSKLACKRFANSLINHFEIAKTTLNKWSEENFSTTLINGKKANQLKDLFINGSSIYEILNPKSETLAEDIKEIENNGFSGYYMKLTHFTFYSKSVENFEGLTYDEILNAFFNFLEIQKRIAKESEMQANEGIYKELIETYHLPEILVRTWKLSFAKQQLEMLKGC